MQAQVVTHGNRCHDWFASAPGQQGSRCASFTSEMCVPMGWLLSVRTVGGGTFHTSSCHLYFPLKHPQETMLPHPTYTYIMIPTGLLVLYHTAAASVT